MQGRVCTTCGRMMESDANWCSGCGASVVQHSPVDVTAPASPESQALVLSEPETTMDDSSAESPSPSDRTRLTPRRRPWVKWIAISVGGIVLLGAGVAFWRYQSAQGTVRMAEAATHQGRYQHALALLKTAQLQWPFGTVGRSQEAIVQQLLQSETAYQSGVTAFNAGDYQQALTWWAKVAPQDIHYAAVQKQMLTLRNLLHAATITDGVLKTALQFNDDITNFQSAYQSASNIYNQTLQNYNPYYAGLFGPSSYQQASIDAFSTAAASLTKVTQQLSNDAPSIAASGGAAQGNSLFDGTSISTILKDTTTLAQDAQSISLAMQDADTVLQGNGGPSISSITASINKDVPKLQSTETAWQQAVVAFTGQVIEKFHQQLGSSVNLDNLLPHAPQAQAL